MKLDRPHAVNPYEYLPEVPSFTLTSEDVTDGEPIDSTFVHGSADGEDVSPQLSWSGFPTETAGFAVTCYDPDVPNLSGWWHWLLLDVPASVTSLPRGAGTADGAHLPAGSFQLRTDYGTIGYGGCAPPPGDRPHRYFFVVHALDVPRLGVDSSVTPAVGSFMITAHEIARAMIVPTFAH